MKTRKTDTNGRMFSPGHQGHEKMFVNPEILGPIKGARSPPSIQLAPLTGVGKMRVDGVGLADTPYVRLALNLLMSDPVPKGIKLRSVGESPDSQLYWSHISYLARPENRVLERLPPSEVVADWFKGDPDTDQTPCICAYFAVYKDILNARAIFSLTYTNGIATLVGVKFFLPGSRGLVRRFKLLNYQERRYRICHLDASNYYYCIPTGRRLGLRCCVKCKGEVFMPRVLCMGIYLACGVAQALTIGCLLKRAPGQDALGVPDEVLQTEVAPGLINLEDGGLIVTIYDSVLIIAEENTAQLWHQRADNNFKDVHVPHKYNKLEGIDAKVPFGGMLLHSSRNGLCWGLDYDQVETWLMIAKSKLLPSGRTLYKLIGFLRFAQPILGWRECALGRLTKYQTTLGVIVDWDEPTLDNTIILAACSLILQIDPKTKRHRKSHVIDRLV